MLRLATVLFLAAAAAAEPAYFRLDFSPSGSQVSIGEPVVKGSMVVYHAYPDGKLMSVRRSTVKSSTKITAKEAAGPAQASLVPIGPLAMQGGTSSGASSAKSTSGAQGARIVPTSDGMAITTAPAGSVSAPGPRIVPTSDGMAITTAAPPK
jgi:hypothetical protein